MQERLGTLYAFHMQKKKYMLQEHQQHVIAKLPEIIYFLQQ